MDGGLSECGGDGSSVCTVVGIMVSVSVCGRMEVGGCEHDFMFRQMTHPLGVSMMFRHVTHPLGANMTRRRSWVARCMCLGTWMPNDHRPKGG